MFGKQKNTAVCRDSFEGCSEHRVNFFNKNNMFWENFDYGYRFENLQVSPPRFAEAS